MSGWDELARSMGSRKSSGGVRSGRPRRPVLCDECIRFLSIHSAFEDQREDGSMAREHIDGCEACQQYFAWKEWNRKREEAFYTSPEVVGLVEEYARRFRLPFWQRRRVQLTGGLLLLVACAALVIFLASHRAQGTPPVLFIGITAPSGSPTPNVVKAISESFDGLDRVYVEGGVPAINKVFSEGTTQDILAAAHWAAERVKTPLIPTFVAALADGRIEVRKAATAALMRMPPLTVKPFVSSVSQADSMEPNPQFGMVLQSFATEISRAR